MMQGAMAGVKGPQRLGSLVVGAQVLEPNLSLSLCDLGQVTLPLRAPYTASIRCGLRSLLRKISRIQ